MSRYIDADRLIDELNRRGIDYRADIDEVIRTTPTADVAPVRHGVFAQIKWERDIALETLEEHGLSPGQKKRHGKWIDKQEVYQTAICSNCKKVTMQERWGDFVRDYDYCPNCGAKMDEEEQE